MPCNRTSRGSSIVEHSGHSRLAPAAACKHLTEQILLVSRGTLLNLTKECASVFKCEYDITYIWIFDSEYIFCFNIF